MFKYLIYLFCCLGCGIQVYQVVDRYLEYRSKSLIQMDFSEEIPMPSLSACFRSSEILKEDMIRREKNISFPIAEDNWGIFYEKFEKLSLFELFKFTPNVHEILSKSSEGCITRMPGKYGTNYPFLNYTFCNKMFNITKYLHRQYICYKFKIYEMTNAVSSIVENNLTPNLPGLMNSLYFDKKLFGNVSFLTSYAHGDDTSQLFDSIFNPSIFNDVMRDGSGRRNGHLFVDLSVTYRAIKIHRLRSPYHPQCIIYHPFKSRLEYILYKIRLETMEHLNIVPTFDHIYEQYNLTFMTAYHVWNDTFSQKLKEIVDRHSRSNPECDIKYFISNIKLSKGKNMRITLFWPQDVNINIAYEPVEVLIDLIVYASSCLGLWFGISLIDVLFSLEAVVIKNNGQVQSEQQKNDYRFVIKQLIDQNRINNFRLIKRIEEIVSTHVTVH